MQTHVRCRHFIAILLLAAALPVLAADKSDKKTKAPEADVPAWEQPQPAVEKIDYGMYARIREEGLQHSHIMEYASALTDAIGPRLTGSPNLAKANAWTRDQLTAMGCVNAHLDDWGEFGMGWQQLNTWVRMTSPDTAVFIAQATPWSPANEWPGERRRGVGEYPGRQGFRPVQGKAGRQDRFSGRDARSAAGRQAAVRALHRQGAGRACAVSGE